MAGSRNKKNDRKSIKAAASLPVIHPHAAGIDIGATTTYVCVPPDSSPEPIGRFDMFTDGLVAMTNWLKECGVKTVAMESTGVYWIPLYQMLAANKFEVMLVRNNYPRDRKSDVEDCQWLQYLHSVGLLTGSFRPDRQVCAVRTILRHRETYVKSAAMAILHMQKSLIQMNVLLTNVVTEITGVTGLAIIKAILAGERNAQRLAELRRPGIKASEDEIVRALNGTYEPEHLFTLGSSLEAWQFCCLQMSRCDRQIEQMLAQIDGDPQSEAQPLPRSTKGGPRRNDVRLQETDLRAEMYRIYGVDLTQIPGIKAQSAHALYCEIGADLSMFQTASHFASWLGLCPDNRISGGRVLSSRTRRVKSRPAMTLRLAAQSLSRSNNYLGDYYRRMRARMGPASANTATAHKLARLIYHMITTKEAFDPSKYDGAQARMDQKRLNKMRTEAAKFGYQLAPIQGVS